MKSPSTKPLGVRLPIHEFQKFSEIALEKKMSKSELAFYLLYRYMDESSQMSNEFLNEDEIKMNKQAYLDKITQYEKRIKELNNYKNDYEKIKTINESNVKELRSMKAKNKKIREIHIPELKNKIKAFEKRIKTKMPLLIEISSIEKLL